MSTIPEPSIDPAHAHPSWCDRSVCTHPDSLVARGETEADVPFHLTSTHMSRHAMVGDPYRDDPSFELWCDRQVDQPVTDEVESIALTIRIPERGFAVTVAVDPVMLDALAAAITDARALVHGHLGGDR